MSEENVRGIILAGLGGQGVVLAARILGHAAVLDGLYAAGSNSYGAQARGSSCIGEVVISAASIDYPRVEHPDVVVAMCQVGFDACMSRIEAGADVLYDLGLVVPVPPCDPRRGFDVARLASSELNSGQVANLLWTGIVAGTTGWFTHQSLERAVRECVPERYAELNLRALAKGLELVGAQERA
jgi:2-oxoglutarate ferredoxin oxidoreductase subunit gamma